MSTTALAQPKSPHPSVWMVLYVPFGAFGGFVSVALTFLGTRHGLSITESSWLNGAQLLTQWLKWLWAPIVDITLTPKRWFVIATTCSAAAVVAMSSIPLGRETLPLLLGVIVVGSLINSIVGMSIEAIMAKTTAPAEVGRVSAWFQAGNLGGAALGGSLGLTLLERLPAPWMSGAILGTIFMATCLVLRLLPDVASHENHGVGLAVKGVLKDLGHMVKTRGGVLAALLCALPVGTGAAQVVLTQANVAGYWGASSTEVALVQGLFAGFVTAAGCFAGGWLCKRFHPRIAYATIGVGLAVIASAMALAPATVTTYVVFSLVYSFGVGIAYTAFTATVLNAMGAGSAATKYTIFASLSNFPIWWLGLLLGRVADTSGSPAMLHTEAALGVVGVLVFVGGTLLVRRSKLAEE